MRERARQEKQQQKAARRQEARTQRPSATGGAPGEDPDIAGIVPGPQPSPWGDEDVLGDETDSDEKTQDA
jgi:hypothetical protein